MALFSTSWDLAFEDWDQYKASLKNCKKNQCLLDRHRQTLRAKPIQNKKLKLNIF